MKGTRLQRVSDWVGWGMARIGRPGQAGLLLLVLAVLTCAAVVKPMEKDMEATRARADELAKRPAPLPAEPAEDAWLASLPANHAGHAHLARLFAAAETAGIDLEEGRYREARDSESHLTRLSITLPVNGAYPELRAFLALALAKEPSLALEGARLSRDDIGAEEIQGELRFVLFLGMRS